MRNMMNLVERELRHHIEHRDSHSGQDDMTLKFHHDGKLVGFIEYSLFQGEVYIQMIQVLPEYRRKGFGSEMLRALQSEYPDTEIQLGGLTDEGAALVNSMKTREIPNGNVAELQAEHAALEQELKDLHARHEALIARVHEPTYDAERQAFVDEVGDRWNEIYDRMDRIEDELRADDRPTKRIFEHELPRTLREGFGPDYLYVSACTDGDHGPGGEAIHIMQDEAQSITFEEFVRCCGTEQLRRVFPQYSWPRDAWDDHEDDGNSLTMQEDYTMREAFHRSRWYGLDCVFCVWSAIEFIFTRDGKTPESEGFDREEWLYSQDDDDGVVMEKYAQETKWLLDYLRNDEFDPYGMWNAIMVIASGTDDEDREVITRAWRLPEDWDLNTLQDDPIHCADPEDWEKLPKYLRDQIAEEATNYMMRYEPAEVPTKIHVSLNQHRLLPSTTWLVHFTDHPWAIRAQGFTRGIDNIERLGLTTHLPDSDKEDGGYNFAFKALSRYATGSAGEKYGKHAVLFQSAGVDTNHYGDQEDQVIFWGPSVDRRAIVIIENDHGEWKVTAYNKQTRRGTVIARLDSYEKAAKWVIQNYSQYRRYF